MTIERADIPKSTEARVIPKQLQAWLAERRISFADWNHRQNLTRRHKHNDTHRKRLALVEHELGDR